MKVKVLSELIIVKEFLKYPGFAKEIIFVLAIDQLSQVIAGEWQNVILF